MKKSVGVVRFLGTNCDRDVWQAVEWSDLKPEWLWYQDRFNPDDHVALVIPGGFSYGDYLRCGALAARTPVMDSVREAYKKGIPILGICNGFQILCEAGLLPGALMRNESGRFVDRWVKMKLANPHPNFAGEFDGPMELPVAHGGGRFVAPSDVLQRIEDNGKVWFHYIDNPNGSMANIAGVMSFEGRAAGLMPHPERAMRDWMGGAQGRAFFESLI